MKKLLLSTLAAATMALPSVAHADTIVFDVTGSQSFADFLDAANEVSFLNIGAGSHVTGVAFDVNITAFSPSYLSEARLAFTDSDVTVGVFSTPGVADFMSGTASYSGNTDLVGAGLDFFVGADGLLRLEFNESFTDGVNPDAIWNSGTYTFTYDPAVTGAVPEPATWALLILGFGLIGGAMRARRKTNVTVTYA